jgi:flagellar basal body-associated protein FliL
VEACSEKWNRSWPHFLLSFLAVLIAVFFIYIASAVPIQALFVRGFFLDKPRTYHFLAVVYTPLGKTYDRYPTFRNGIDKCAAYVAQFMPKQEQHTFKYVDSLGQHALADGESKSGTETKKMSVPLNKLLVNIVGTTRQLNLLVSVIVVGAGGETFKAKMTEYDARLRDMAMGALATNTLADLEKPGARDLIRAELINGFNTVIGDNSVQEIYFTEFGVQSGPPLQRK